MDLKRREKEQREEVDKYWENRKERRRKSEAHSREGIRPSSLIAQGIEEEKRRNKKEMEDKLRQDMEQVEEMRIQMHKGNFIELPQNGSCCCPLASARCANGQCRYRHASSGGG